MKHILKYITIILLYKNLHKIFILKEIQSVSWKKKFLS